RKILDWPKAIDQLRRRLWSTTGNPGKAVSRITHEREIIGDKPRLDAKLRAHSFRIANHIASTIDLHDAIVDDALRQIFVRRPDANFLDTFVLRREISRGRERVVSLELDHRPNNDA